MKLDLRVSQLENGLRVVTSATPAVASVAIGVWVAVGGRHEASRLSGISHFIEHLLFKGTTTRSAREISQAIEGRGGYFNAFTQEESTCYYAHVAAAHAADVLDILTDMYRCPRFAPADIAKERGVIVEEIQMYHDQPQQLVQEMLGGLLWPDHPLGRPLAGRPATVQRLQRADFLAYKHRYYQPAATLVVLAGQVEHAQAVAQVRQRLGRLRPQRAPACRPVTARTPQRDAIVRGKEIEQAHLALGLRLFGRHDPRRFALKLLSTVLGENMSSRLFQIIRERHGLAYSIHTSVDLFRDTGVLAISAGVDGDNLRRALELTVREIARLRAQPVSAAELRRARDYVIGQLLLGLENTSARMMWAADNILNYGRFIQPAEIMKRFRRVTAHDVQTLAGDLFDPRRLSLALVAPEAGKAEEKLLRECARKLG